MYIKNFNLKFFITNILKNLKFKLFNIKIFLKIQIQHILKRI